MAGNHSPALDQINRWFMGNIRGEERANERDVIHMPRNIGQSIGYPHSAPSVLRELEWTPHDRPGVFDVLHLARNFAEVRLTVMFIERGFRIEQIHLARPTVHEKMNHRFRFGGKMRLTRTQVREWSMFLGPERLTEEMKKSRSLNASAHAFKEAAPI